MTDSIHYEAAGVVSQKAFTFVKCKISVCWAVAFEAEN